MKNLDGITNTDKIKRVIFVRHCQNQLEGMSEYLSRLVFSDECIFRLNGSVNTQHIIILCTERLVEVREIFSNSPGIMV